MRLVLCMCDAKVSRFVAVTVESSAAGIEATCVAYNALLAGHAELGSLEEADALVDSMTAVKVQVPHI